MAFTGQLRATKPLPSVNCEPQADAHECSARIADSEFRSKALAWLNPVRIRLRQAESLSSRDIFRMLAAVRILRYGLIGTGAALLQLSLLVIFVEIFDLYPLLASTAALAISVLTNYGLQRRFTFQSKSRHVVAGPLFAGLTLVTLSANALLFSAMLAVLPYLAAQIITTATIFPVNYYLNKTITFSTRFGGPTVGTSGTRRKPS